MNLREWARATHRVLSEHWEEGGTVLSGDIVEQVLRAAIKTLIDALVDGGELRIDALGRLWVEERAAQRITSNLVGQQRVYTIKSRRVVRFRASRRLAGKVNDRRTGDEPELVRERALEVAKDPRESRGREEDGRGGG